MTTKILLQKYGDGYEIVLNSPEKRNALDADGWDSLTSALGEAASGEPRYLVLRGEGSSFCAGGDLTSMRTELAAARGPEDFRSRIHSCLRELYGFPAPTVASVRGAAVGGGLELALACDLRVVSTDALFRMPAARFGMVMGVPELQRLAATVGWSWARAIVLTGMNVDSELAARIGIAHRVVDGEHLENATMDFVELIGSMEPAAIRWSRQVLEASMNGVVTTEMRRFETDCFRRDEFWSRIG